MISLKELSARYAEQGASGRSKNRIKAQLARKCQYKDCEASLAFTVSKKRYCSEKHRRAEQLRLRTINREKKRRYYEKHGITFDKTVRNRKIDALSPSTNGQLYSGQVLLYENYKEPLKKIPKAKGFGYYGTLAMTEDKEYVQCHVCGHLFAHLGAHLRQHKITAEKYRETYGLAATTALVSEPQRERIIQNVVSKNTVIGKGLPVWLQDYNRKIQSGQIKHPGTKRKEGGLSLEKRNEIGYCPDQVLEKIRALADELGHTPSLEEFQRHYSYKYLGSIKFQHGSYLKAVKKLGLKSAKELKEPTNEELLQDLVDFHKEHGRIPMRSDFSRGLLRARQIYWRRFGSMNNARIEAGLNAVLPLPFGQKVEMTPEEYIEYRNKRLKGAK